MTAQILELYTKDKLSIIRYTDNRNMYILLYGRLQGYVQCLKIMGTDLTKDFETNVPQVKKHLLSI